jgi:tetratricopeptide (TPR) repeat protein
MDRLQMLQDLLAQDPNNQLARYGLGMEYSGKGEVESAVAEFKKLVEINPDYANAYFMAAQTLAKAERADEAKQLLRQGITAAARTGNSHAQGEMQAFLDELEY